MHRGRQETLQPIELEGQVFAPSKVVRWLGFFLDSKLSFKIHVEKKTAAAQKVFAQLQRLGNTQQGLTVQALRQLYLACITTVADYGAHLWWHTERKGRLLKHYNALQNLALPRMLGAFKSSPTMAMEIEAAILPSSLRLEKLCSSYALRTLLFPKQHPIQQALHKPETEYGEETDTDTSINSSTSLDKQANTQLRRLVSRNQALPSQQPIERVSHLWNKPWDNPITNYASISISIESKEKTAEAHLQWLQKMEQENNKPILLYTDGSKEPEGTTAAGFCHQEPKNKGKFLAARAFNLGNHMEIMDAELVAISKALKYLQSRNTTGKTIYICADSQAALKRLEKTARTGGQELTYDITQACKALQSAHKRQKATLSCRCRSHAHGLCSEAKEGPCDLSLIFGCFERCELLNCWL